MAKRKQTKTPTKVVKTPEEKITFPIENIENNFDFNEIELEDIAPENSDLWGKLMQHKCQPIYTFVPSFLTEANPDAKTPDGRTMRRDLIKRDKTIDEETPEVVSLNTHIERFNKMIESGVTTTSALFPLWYWTTCLYFPDIEAYMVQGQINLFSVNMNKEGTVNTRWFLTRQEVMEDLHKYIDHFIDHPKSPMDLKKEGTYPADLPYIAVYHYSNLLNMIEKTREIYTKQFKESRYQKNQTLALIVNSMEANYHNPNKEEQEVEVEGVAKVSEEVSNKESGNQSQFDAFFKGDEVEDMEFFLGFIDYLRETRRYEMLARLKAEFEEMDFLEGVTPWMDDIKEL